MNGTMICDMRFSINAPAEETAQYTDGLRL